MLCPPMTPLEAELLTAGMWHCQCAAGPHSAFMDGHSGSLHCSFLNRVNSPAGVLRPSGPWGRCRASRGSLPHLHVYNWQPFRELMATEGRQGLKKPGQALQCGPDCLPTEQGKLQQHQNTPGRKNAGKPYPWKRFPDDLGMREKYFSILSVWERHCGLAKDDE